jgi:hypothetical protein
MPNPLRIPAWLTAVSAIVIVGALIRVLKLRGAPGIAGFFEVLLPVMLVGYGMVVVEKIEAREESSVGMWPGAKFRRRLFLALLIVTDCCCVSMLLLGSRFIDAFGI